MKQGWQKRVSYRFWAAGELWETDDWSDTHIRIEEVAKNGQEDCHMYGEFVKGKYAWEVMMDDDHPCENISEYSSNSTVTAILMFLNTYGVPETNQ